MPAKQYETSVLIRAAREDDDPRIAQVARHNGQPEVLSGADPRYTAHLRRYGQLLVAQAHKQVIGFGATIDIGPVSLLTDLFVDPQRQSSGVGAALIGELWPADDHACGRFTFASQDPRAISLYARAGLTPLWPLLYLRGMATTLPPPALHAERVPVAEAVRAQARLTGGDRRNDLTLLAGGPSGGLIIARDDRVIAAGVVTPDNTLAHLACPDPSAATEAVTAGLRTLGEGMNSVCVPGPHPAVPQLLTAGYHITDFDICMATEPDLLATTWVYSPSLG